jgi:hypothetical protein
MANKEWEVGAAERNERLLIKPENRKIDLRENEAKPGDLASTARWKTRVVS